MVRKIVIIVIPVAAVAVILFLLAGIPVLGFQYTLWKIEGF